MQILKNNFVALSFQFFHLNHFSFKTVIQTPHYLVCSSKDLFQSVNVPLKAYSSINLGLHPEVLLMFAPVLLFVFCLFVNQCR